MPYYQPERRELIQKDGWKAEDHPAGEPIEVTEDVFEGLEECREDGSFNMFDTQSVQWLAHQFGHRATVLWIEDNPDKYTVGIFNGFTPVEGKYFG